VTATDVAAIARHALIDTLLFASPLLAASILIGVLTGLLQAGMRMNDLTLSFVPRFVAVMLVLTLAAAWLGRHMAADLEQAIVAMATVVS